MLNMSFAAVFLGISKSTQNNYFKENLIDIQYFIKEHLWISAFDEATPKKLFGRSKPSWKLTLKQNGTTVVAAVIIL